MPKTVTSADGTTIAYDRLGSGPPLILVGGAMSNRNSAAPLVPLLSPRFSVISFDRRGRGDSGNTHPYAPEREFEDLEALIVAAGGAARVFGHSSGAVLTLESAARGAGITRLAVYEPPYLTSAVTDVPPAEHAAQIQAALDEGHPEAAVELFIRGTGAPWDDSIKKTPWWAGMVAVAPTLPYDMAIVGDSSVPTDRLSRVLVKTLGIYGGASAPWAHDSIAAVTSAIPGATMDMLPGQGHGAAPDVLAPVLIDFFT